MRQPCYLASTGARPAPTGVPAVDIGKFDQYDTDKLAFWLVDMSDWRAGWEQICLIRRHLSPGIYLRPIICWLGVDDVPTELLQAADGYLQDRELTLTALESLAAGMEPINQRIEYLSGDGSVADSNVTYKVLRLIASRDREIEPLTTTRRKVGFVYPMLEPLFMKRDEGLLDTLGFLHSRKLLSGRFVSKAFFCNHCDSAFLNFKETCPQCSSSDLNIDDLVHHFKCAYVGEMSEFRRGEDLVCPKCERSLRHIGVDYDKPSIVYNCNHCSHTFQDPTVMTACYHCSRSTKPENQVVRTIQAYSITALGQNAAEYGLETLFTSILESELKLYSFNAFRDFFQVEVSRIGRYKRSISSLAMIRLTDMNKLYVRLGRRTGEVFSELSALFRTVLRQSDVITVHNESVFFIIMTETDREQAQLVVERLQEGIASLMQNNLDIQQGMVCRVREIDGKTDLDSTLEQFLQEHVV